MELTVNLDGLCALVADESAGTVTALLLDARQPRLSDNHGVNHGNVELPAHIPFMRFGDGLYGAYGAQESAFPLYLLSRQELTFEAPGASAGVHGLAKLDQYIPQLEGRLDPECLLDPPALSVVARVVFSTGEIEYQERLSGDLVDAVSGAPVPSTQREFFGRVNVRIQSGDGIVVSARPFRDPSSGSVGGWQLPLRGDGPQELKIGNLPWDALWFSSGDPDRPTYGGLVDANGGRVDHHFARLYELLKGRPNPKTLPRILPDPATLGVPSRANPWCLVSKASL